MAISSILDDALDEFRGDHGRDANVIYLGRMQIAQLDAFVAAYGKGRVAPHEAKGFPNYNGIRVVKVDQDSHLSVDCVSENELPDE